MNQRFTVDLTPRGFVVVDNAHDRVIRGAFVARYKAQEVATELNAAGHVGDPFTGHSRKRISESEGA